MAAAAASSRAFVQDWNSSDAAVHGFGKVKMAGRSAAALEGADGVSIATTRVPEVACAFSSRSQITGGRSCRLNFPAVSCSTRARIVVPPSSPRKQKFSRRALKVDAVVLTENWVSSEEAVATAAAEEAMALARAAAKAARDAAAYAHAQAMSDEFLDFPSEMDLLRLERARLSEMERLQRIETEPEGCDPQSESEQRSQVETFWADSTSMTREEDSAMAVGSETSETDALHKPLHKNRRDQPETPRKREDVTVVRSKRRVERLLRRERALEKAERVAASVASAPIHFRPKKAQVSQDLSDPVRAYLREIGKSKLLTAAEEIELSTGIQDLLKMEKVKKSLKEQIGREPTIGEWACAAGLDQNVLEMRIKEGQFCKDKMVSSNLRLVVSIAKHYQGRGMTLQDLIQEGSMGLIRGAEKFDHNKGFKFSTYAHWWIRQAVTRAIADQSRTIRLPIHLYEVISRIHKAKKMLSQEHARPPRDEEVAELVGMTVEKLRAVVKSARAPTSMERPIGQDTETTIGELVPDKDVDSPEDAIAKQLLKQDLERVMSTLNPREREVLRLRYGLDDGRMKTLEEIGNFFKVTRERIRQIEAKALRKLQQPTRNGVLREYLDVAGIS